MEVTMQLLKGFYMLILFFALSLGNLLAQDMSDMQEKVNQWNDEYVKATIHNDREKILSFYADDAISMPSYSPMIIGKDSLEAEMMREDTASSKITSFNLNSKKLISSGDLLIDIGTYDLTMNMQGMDEPIQDHGKYLTMYEKQSDGSWKIKAETWNSDINPWTSQDDNSNNK
jgi:ketosteroid isomerase-like protein